MQTSSSTDNAKRLNVVYILGSTRSGSTLFGNLLGQVEGVFFAGELSRVWHPPERTAGLCSCGKREQDCEIWRKVFNELGFDTIELAHMRAMRDRLTRLRQFMLFRLIPGYEAIVLKSCRQFVETIEHLYHSVARVTGCQTIVDSSKSPVYAYLLRHIPSLRLYPVHLVRDARAVAFSWRRQKTSPSTRGELKMARQPLWFSTAWWVAWNGLSSALFETYPNYLRVRYEDFARHPRSVIERVLTQVGLPIQGLDGIFIGEHEALISSHHILRGNPNRFIEGVISIQPDQQWRQAMAKSEQAIVTALGFPLLLYYGYV